MATKRRRLKTKNKKKNNKTRKVGGVNLTKALWGTDDAEDAAAKAAAAQDPVGDADELNRFLDEASKYENKEELVEEEKTNEAQSEPTSVDIAKIAREVSLAARKAADALEAMKVDVKKAEEEAESGEEEAREASDSENEEVLIPGSDVATSDVKEDPVKRIMQLTNAFNRLAVDMKDATTMDQFNKISATGRRFGELKVNNMGRLNTKIKITPEGELKNELRTARRDIGSSIDASIKAFDEAKTQKEAELKTPVSSDDELSRQLENGIKKREEEEEQLVETINKSVDIEDLGTAAGNVADAIREVASKLKPNEVIGNKVVTDEPPTNEVVVADTATGVADEPQTNAGLGAQDDVSEIEDLLAGVDEKQTENKLTGLAMEVRNISEKFPTLRLILKNKDETLHEAILQLHIKSGVSLNEGSDVYKGIHAHFLALQDMEPADITAADLIHYVHPDKKTEIVVTEDPLSEFISEKLRVDVKRTPKERFMEYVLSLYTLPLADVFRTQLSLFTDQPFEPGIKDNRYPARYANYVKILDVSTYTMYKTSSKSHNERHEDIKDNYRNYVEQLNEYIKNKTKSFTNFKDLLSDSIVHMTDLNMKIKNEAESLESEYKKAISWIDKGTMSGDEKKTQTEQLKKLKIKRYKQEKHTQSVFDEVKDTVKAILLQFDKREAEYKAKTVWTDKDKLNLVLDELQERLNVTDSKCEGGINICKPTISDYYRHVGYGDFNKDYEKYVADIKKIDEKIKKEEELLTQVNEEEKVKKAKIDADNIASAAVSSNTSALVANKNIGKGLEMVAKGSFPGFVKNLIGGKDQTYKGQKNNINKELAKLRMEKITITKEFDDKRRFLETSILDLSEVGDFDESSYIAYLKLQKLYKILHTENKYVLYKYFDGITTPTFGDFGPEFITNYFKVKVAKYRLGAETRTICAIDTLIDKLLSETGTDNTILIYRLQCYKVFCLDKTSRSATRPYQDKCGNKAIYTKTATLLSFTEQLKEKESLYKVEVDFILNNYNKCKSLASTLPKKDTTSPPPPPNTATQQNYTIKNKLPSRLNTTFKAKPVIIRPKFNVAIESDLKMIGYDKGKIPNPTPILITINKTGLTINNEVVDTKDKWDAVREMYLGYGKSQDDFKLPTYTNGELRFIIDTQSQKIAVSINKGKEILINNMKQLEELRSALNKV